MELIQSGISRNDIKIRKSRIYVQNKPYGEYTNSVFVHSDLPAFSLASFPGLRGGEGRPGTHCARMRVIIAKFT